jgi:potassium efflux system protein
MLTTEFRLLNRLTAFATCSELQSIRSLTDLYSATYRQGRLGHDAVAVILRSRVGVKSFKLRVTSLGSWLCCWALVAPLALGQSSALPLPGAFATHSSLPSPVSPQFPVVGRAWTVEPTNGQSVTTAVHLDSASASSSGVVFATQLQVASTDPASSELIDEGLTVERVAVEIASVEALTDISVEAKKEHLERLNKAVKSLQDEADSVRRKAELDMQLAAVPEQLRLAHEELARPSPPLLIDFPAAPTVQQLEAKLAELRHQVEVDEAASKAKEEACENRAKRLSEISKEMIETDKRIVDIKAQLAGLVDSDLSTKTQLIELKTRLRRRTQQLLTYKAEQLRLEAVSELLPMQRDLAKRTASNSRKLLQGWQSAVDTWRKEESTRQAAQARRVAENSHPALKSLAIKNAEIAELRIQTAAGIERLAKTIKDIQEQTSKNEVAFKELQEKVEHAGATSSTGVLLLKQRDELPASAQFQAQTEFVQKAMPEAHLKLLELNQLRREMSDPAEMASEMLSSFSESLANYDQQQVLEVVTGLLTDRRDFLDRASIDQSTYLQELNKLELANQALSDLVDRFRQYLDQRVMWIRSAEPIQARDFQQAVAGMATLASPMRWLEVLRVSGGELLRRPAGAIAVVSLFLLLLLGRARLLAVQNRLTEPVAADQFDRYWPKVAAMLITVVLSARWPLLLLAVGFRLKYAAGSTPWTQAVGQSCLTTMVFLWGLELMREICRRNGIGERLFHWPSKATSAIRNMLELTLVLGTPLLSLLQLSKFGELAGLKGLERTLFMLAMILTSLQYAILYRPHGRMMSSLGSDEVHFNSMFVRFKVPNWIVATLAPLSLVMLSAAGYHFSAFQLSARMTETSAAIIAVLLIHHMLLIWLDVKAHNFQASHAHDETPTQAVTNTFRFVSEDGDDAEELEEEPKTSPLVQSQLKSYQEFRDLLRYGAIISLLCSGWFIWDSVLPALRVLDQVELWNNIETVAETVVDSEGFEKSGTHERRVPTTLTDLLMAMTIFGGTLTVSARLPGLLQLTILERLPLDHGGRQAIAILVRYSVTLVGLLVACQMMRISWSSVQWLAAAMTVGLGFGLQEIFANLVSGLIILFERPIRLGDLVTVGTVTGNVTRMQMRATTITDFDRREMIVPNKTFITDNVINWTLSDPISRVVLPVGVAYGTDVQRTQAILLRIAKRCSFVMSEPPPTTLFRGFGDSRLNLELRVFIPKRDVYSDVVNELNNAIVREFARYKIEIAFPQHDLHIRSVESLKPLLTGLVQGETENQVKRAA